MKIPFFFNSKWLEAKAKGINLSTKPLLPNRKNLPTVDLSDRAAVISYVLKNCDAVNFVYPTEQYFYFKFYSGHRLISGNLRFCESEKGVVHFGYFDEHDPSVSFFGSIKNDQNGAVITNNDCVTLRFLDIERKFVIKYLRINDNDQKLQNGEEVICRVLDESGYHFKLLFNQSDNYFFYVLDESENLPEPLSELTVGDFKFYVGLESRFILFRDQISKRRILVGVQIDKIKWNTYFDGPFDQVPPNLDLKDRLERAYPYVRYRGGIDKHGNFRKVYGSRVAISPYKEYSTVSEFLAFALPTIYKSNKQGKPAYQGLVLEDKASFHKKLEGLDANSDAKN